MKADRADKRSIVTCTEPAERRADRRFGRERGQAMVEFALIAPLFVALVAGVIQFGVALNYWLDLQRIANQGARWAAVNRYPVDQKNPDGSSNPYYPACTKVSAPAPCNPTLEESLERMVISKGNDPTVEICFPPTGQAPKVGDPVRVTLITRYRLQALLRLAKIDLKATATMRLEQEPTVLTGQGVTTCPP